MKNNELPIIVDAHSHVQFPAYDADREAVLQRAKDAGVKMIAVGTQASTSEAGILLAHKNPDAVWAAVGFHPGHVVLAQHARMSADSNADQRGGWHHDKNEQSQAEAERFDIARLRELAADPKVVAIGECGLDYYRLVTSDQRLVTSIKEKQKEVFLQQAQLAQELDKALMIHCRPSKGTDDAYEDLLELSQMSNVKSQRSVIHFYVGSLAITKKLVAAGFYFTFGGVVTFARDYDESIKYIPLDRILLETDCPYVAPKSNRGKRNEPSFIRETAAVLSGIKNIGTDALLAQVYENSKKVFRI